MSFEVDVSVVGDVVADAEAVHRDATALLEALEMEEGTELSVVLCDDATIHSMNAEWRGVDAPTDVLSFPQQDPEEDLGAPVHLLGDVVISIPTARRQATERGHDLATEVRVLLVHGLLHLLGHDHHEEQDADGMRERELSLLRTLGERDPLGLVARAHGG